MTPEPWWHNEGGVSVREGQHWSHSPGAHNQTPHMTNGPAPLPLTSDTQTHLQAGSPNITRPACAYVCKKTFHFSFASALCLCPGDRRERSHTLTPCTHFLFNPRFYPSHLGESAHTPTHSTIKEGVFSQQGHKMGTTFPRGLWGRSVCLTDLNGSLMMFVSESPILPLQVNTTSTTTRDSPLAKSNANNQKAILTKFEWFWFM